MAISLRRRAILGAIATSPLWSGPFIRRAYAAEIVFKLADPLAATHPTNVWLKHAADKIKEDSGGRIQLRLFPNGQLGNDVDLLNQVRSGAIEMYVVGGLIASSVVPEAALGGVGFAFKNTTTVLKGMDGALGEYIRAAMLKQAGLYAPATIWDYGFRQITSSVRPIKIVDDLAGMKIRVPGADAYVSLFKALGASPTSLAFNELYPALQTKIVDGQENPLGVILTSKFYEVQKYCSLTNHIWQGNWILINGRAWGRLSSNLQEIMEKRLNEAGVAQRKDLAGKEQSFKDALVAHGLKFNTVDTESFRKKLTASGYYAAEKKKFGKKAWSVLESAAGGTLA